MKILFVSCSTNDWTASTLWYGLREVCGKENVYDATGGSRDVPEIPGIAEPIGDEKDFDLMVLNACFMREHDWDWVESLRERLKPSAKIAFVEGWDSAGEAHVPPFSCDAYFRREIIPGINYGYSCHPTLFAMPESAFDLRENKRKVDVSCLINVKNIMIRYEVLRQVIPLRERLNVAAYGGGVPGGEYIETMRHAKLAICPPGAGSDCMHPWQAIACGAIPVFVSHPPRIREPWLPEGSYIWCDNVNDLPRIIDHALGLDLNSMRRRLQEDGLKNHTTAARARRLLTLTGVQF